MNKAISLLFLAGASALANAGPIAGKIALGTWNTQAEFADIKVVKGSQRLYQSNFWAGTAGMTLSGGNWSTANGILRQTGGGTPALATVGDPSWTNYTITLKARKTGGAEGFLIGFGMPNDSTTSWWNIAGWNNTQSAIQAPGFSMLTQSGSVQTGRWYSVKIEVKGSDLRCYLDGVKTIDTMRLSDDAEWSDRNDQILNSNGLTRLPGWEQDQVRELLGRNVYRGGAARAKFDALPGKDAFIALGSVEQAALIRKVNRNRATWNWGYINDPNDAYKINTIADAMDGACMLYNSAGVFDKHETVESVPSEWVPTADAGYGGTIRFGGSWNRRVAIHEMSHTLGTGTTGEWGGLMYDGFWHGAYADLQIKAFDGPDARLWGDSQHYWPYGENQDSEWSPENERRTASIVAALRRDMNLSGVRNTVYATDVVDGTYRLTPRLAPNSAIEVANGDASTPLNVRAYSGAQGQKFRLEKQADGSYRIRTNLPGGRCVDLSGGDASNGQTVQLWEDNGNDAQRWYLIPMGDGWYKVAPKNGVWKTLDLWGASAADGTPVKLWDFYDGFGQLFRLDKLG